MRKIFLLLIISSLLYNCKTGIITEELKKDKIMFETFDYDKFEKENKKHKDPERSNVYIFERGREVWASWTDIYEIPYNPYFFLSYKEFYEIPGKPSTIKEKGKYFGDISLGSNSGVKIGYWYYFDEKGKLKQEVDEDKKFGKFSYNEVLKFLDEKKYINLSTGEGRDKVNVEFYNSDKSNKKLWKVLINIGKPYGVANLPEDKGMRYAQDGKSYYLDGSTGEIIKGKKLLEYKEIIPNFEKEFPMLIESTTTYRTHDGKNYTQSEWQAYEEKQYEEYCKRTGRPYTPKNQNQEKIADNQEYKSPFIADDFEKGDDNTPKKKGFLGGFFS